MARRTKGDTGELEVVQIGRRSGLARCWQTSRIQTAGGNAPDVRLGPYRVEVKFRESISKLLWQWHKGHDILAIRREDHPWLGVVDLEWLCSELAELEELRKTAPYATRP